MCLRYYQKANDYRGIVWAFEGIAQIHKNTGRYTSALSLFIKAKDLARASCDYRGLGYALKGIGECQHTIDRQDKGGLTNIYASVLLFESLQFNIGSGYAMKAYADALYGAGEIYESFAAYQDANKIFLNIKNLRGLAYVALGFAEIAFALGKPHKGMYYVHIATAYFKEKAVRFGFWKAMQLIDKWNPEPYRTSHFETGMFASGLCSQLLDETPDIRWLHT
jgi:tetratricopeptide (TPR) repeat protein